MKAKTKCKKCGLLIDSDLETCPYCGYKQDEPGDKTKPEVIEKEPEKPRKIHFFDFPSRALDVSIAKSTLYFFAGLIFLQIFVLFFNIISSTNDHFAHTTTGGAAINFSIYFIIFGIMLLITNSDITKITNDFKKGSTWILGIGFGFLMMIVSSAVSLIFKSMAPSTGVNSNEQAVDTMTSLYPFLATIVFGFLGPICEEFTYRAGLFNILKRFNRILAYIGVALIFGLIHFNFQAFGIDEIVTELVNIPSYIVSGLLLCYFYDYGGLGASILAHITNNFVAVLLQILMGAI